IGQALNSVTGILALRQMASKLEPRSATDIALGPPSLAAFTPTLAYARVGVTNNLPTYAPALTVNLSGNAQGDTVVNLTSGDAALTVPASVTVLNGTSSIAVPVTANAANPDVSVTAALATAATKTMTGHVRVLGAAEVPTTVTLSPATAVVAPNGTTTLTATLDLPALGATVINLAATTGGTVPATVTVLDTQTTATFTYTDSASVADVTVTATFGASTSTATVKVSTGVSHLVINEVDYDNIGTGDSKEYVEIFNPSLAPISLVGVKLYLVNGSNSTVYTTVDLSSAVSLPSQGYLVVAGAGVIVPATALKITPTPAWTTNAIQNGDPDGLLIVDSTTNTVIDALSYGGAITAVTIPGIAAKVSLVEGTAATAKDSNTVEGSLCRKPNGQDTDNANADWKFCTPLTVGIANPN
ncbi:MAG: lamin tail domain-containing protein, partial [Polyangiaceae bacterium]